MPNKFDEIHGYKLDSEQYDSELQLDNPLETATAAAARMGRSLDEILAGRRATPFVVKYPTPHCLDESFASFDYKNLPEEVRGHLRYCNVCASIVEGASEAEEDASDVVKFLSEIVRREKDENSHRASFLGRAHSPKELKALAKERQGDQKRRRLITASR